MTLMNATTWMDKLGMSLVNAVLLAGLPAAVVAIVAQAM